MVIDCGQIKQGSMTYVFLICVVAAMGGLLFGYDAAVIAGAIGFIADKFQLTPLMKGWAASSALAACVFGAMFAGMLSDRMGRKKVLMLSAVLFLISAIWSAMASTVTELVLARIIGGLGIGMVAMMSPLYIAEVSPARLRGRLVCMNQIAILTGMIAVSIVNAVIARHGNEAWNIDYGWRWMFGCGAIPVITFLVPLFFVPESPRWLTEMGKEAQALTILTRLGGTEQAVAEMEEIKGVIAQESASIWQLFAPGIRVALLIGLGLAILQQITGINAVLYYTPEIFKKTGITAVSAISDTIIINVANLFFTLIAISLVDRIGRKPLLLIASVGMGISLFFMGLAFQMQRFEGPWVLICMLAYVAAFAIGVGPIVWVVISEIFPTKIRGRAMSVTTVFLWISCFLVSQFFPYLLETLKGKVFWVYASLCLIQFIFVLVLVPETKGKSLEAIERMWIKRQ